MKTEAEARKCACPFKFGRQTITVYGQHPGAGGGGGGGSEPTPPNCIASECMAWRWRKRDAEPHDNSMPMKSDFPHGYCGLAGEP